MATYFIPIAISHFLFWDDFKKVSVVDIDVSTSLTLAKNKQTFYQKHIEMLWNINTPEFKA